MKLENPPYSIAPPHTHMDSIGFVNPRSYDDHSHDEDDCCDTCCWALAIVNLLIGIPYCIVTALPALVAATTWSAGDVMKIVLICFFGGAWCLLVSLIILGVSAWCYGLYTNSEYTEIGGDATV